MKVILLNGAPRSGKDTLSKEIRAVAAIEGLRVTGVSIGHKLKDITHAAYNAVNGSPHSLTVPHWQAFEGTKDQPNEFFLGITPRRAYIAMHEALQFQHGDTFLADRLAEALESDRASDRCVVVTDIGNYDEAKSFSKFQPTLVRVGREGVEWDNRRPVPVSPAHYHTIDYESMLDPNKIRHWIKTELLSHMS